MPELMKLADLPDDFTPGQFMWLDRESLDAVPFERKRWVCECKGCQRGTTVRDYGMAPYYWLDRNSKSSKSQPWRYWNNLMNYHWLCSKHWAMFRRLMKHFDRRHIERKFLDPMKVRIQPIDRKPTEGMAMVKSIE